MIPAVTGSQILPRLVMNGTTQRVNRAVSEEANESPATRLAEAQGNSVGQSNLSSLGQLNKHIGQRLDVRI